MEWNGMDRTEQNRTEQNRLYCHCTPGYNKAKMWKNKLFKDNK